jgi:sRNA-binding carbon storage regulator CsrA
MLVLTSKVQERIFIDVPPSTEWQRIEVFPVEIRRDKVRTAFVAERCIEIVREGAVKKTGRAADAKAD